MLLKYVRVGFILLTFFVVVRVISDFHLRFIGFQEENPLDISLHDYNVANIRDTVLNGNSCRQNVVLRNASTSLNITAPDWKRLKSMFNWLEAGGRYRPRHCSDPHRVAIIIPFENRDEQLRIFLQNMHPFLKSQNIQYGVYVIEPVTNATFNKAIMMNIGFVEASRRMDYQCYIFHDVDLLPRNEANMYTCPRTPRHMAVLVDRFDYKYYKPSGGVMAFSKEHFQMVNGYSNLYFGWGKEDDDMFYRIKASKLPISRYPDDVATYSMIRHKRDANNKLNRNGYNENRKSLKTTQSRPDTNILNAHQSFNIGVYRSDRTGFCFM